MPWTNGYENDNGDDDVFATLMTMNETNAMNGSARTQVIECPPSRAKTKSSLESVTFEGVDGLDTAFPLVSGLSRHREHDTHEHDQD